ncbi:MAG: GNAT family N-acetyltransferase [Candidatus Limivicinus sp.]|jgi:probable phosphoglycerate mutase
MTEIYLIRHTQAEGNLYHMMQGHWNGGVTALGLREIDALAERFKNIPVDAVYASDLYRARKTASAVTKYHPMPIISEPKLREINVGAWETEFFGDVLYRYPEKTREFMEEPGKWHVEGAETYAMVQDRAFAALREIAERHPGESVAVVSHGVTIRCIIAKLTGADFNSPEMPPVFGNTSISHLRFEDGKFEIVTLNDSSHLDKLDIPSWTRAPEIRSEKLDPAADYRYYTACYADAWMVSHGTLAGFSPSLYLACAEEHSRFSGDAVLRFYCGDEPAGLLDMDMERGASEGWGWVSLLYMNEEYRGRGCGIQALARAYKAYGNLGRSAVRLHVAAGNTAAVDFYRRNGFRHISSETNSLGELLLMERKLGVEDDV